MTTYEELNEIMLDNPCLFEGLNEDRQEKFKDWLPGNMNVYQAFVGYARQLKKSAKRDYYSARAIWERLRWESMTADTGIEYKINDLYMPFISWLSMAAEPDLAGMFQTRKKAA